MKESRKMNRRRRLSGLLAFIMTATLVLGDATMALASVDAADRFLREAAELSGDGAYSRATLSNATFQNNREDQLSISVFSSSDSDFRAGETVYLDVHMKNESGSQITDGVLTYKAKGIDKETAYFEEPEDMEPEETDTEETDLEAEEPLQSIKGITLAPGQIFTARFVYTIDQDIDSAKKQNVLFRFEGENGDGRVEREETFHYSVNFLNVDQILFEDGNQVETGEEVVMGIRTGLYDFDAALKDSSVDLSQLATPGNATPGNAEASPANAAYDVEEDYDDDTFVIDLGKSTYKIEMTNAKLNDFQIRKALVDNAYENMLICTYRVSKDVEPGVYFGRVIQETAVGGRSFRSSQGFSIIVTGDGQITLKDKAGDAEVIVTGPVTSFPEANQLALSVSEVTADQQAMVDEALAKKSAEEGVEVSAMKALDIKIYADGVETEPTGPIQVAFKNVELEEKQPAVMRAAAAVASLFDEEKEESTTRVFHLDEDALVANEMDSAVDEDGTVVMDTDHFSIYIVVNVPDKKEITVTVEHYATVDKWNIVDGKLYEYVEGTALGKKMIPGAQSNGKMATESRKIYSDDKVTLPSGAGTGIGYSIAVEKWSKVAAAGNYKVESVTVTKPDGTKATYKDGAEIHLGDKDKLTINYIPTTGTLDEYAAFHDYNVTVPGSDSKHSVDTRRKGINNWNLAKTTDRVGVGIYGTGAANIFHNYTGISNVDPGSVKKGIAKSTLEGNNIKFKQADPGLFASRDIVIAETATNGSTINGYIAKKYLPNYKLQFNRKGDTYTLAKVYDSNGKQLQSGLDQLKCTYTSTEKQLYSNLFWPLDKVAYGTQGKTRDPLFGNNYGFGQNDESATSKHNWFFGMRYDFKFVLGDYEGPLNYYFRGDDDFWLYVDGKLVNSVDLGGVHSSTGAYVDLSTVIDRTDKKTEHSMSVFFMERGGFGSCCYMAFTLPNVVPIPSPETEVVTFNVEKKWLDGNDEDGYRPDYVWVQLLQDGHNFGSPVKLEEANDWKHTWTSLPKYSEVGNNKLHVYTVKEVTTPPHYQSSTKKDGDYSAVITNTQLTSVSVEKQWSGGNPGTEVKVGLFDGNKKQVAGTSIVTLNEANKWTHTWTDLVKYNADGSERTYVPYEVDANGKPVEAGKTVDGEKYIVNYNPDHSVIYNTYNYRTVTVEKIWEDYDNAYGTRPASIWVQLYRNGNTCGKPVELNAEGGWKYTWTDLPDKPSAGEPGYTYTVFELDRNGAKVTNGSMGQVLGVGENGHSYKYKATYDYNHQGTEADPLKITNTLRTAKLRLRKEIRNSEGLPSEPIDRDYKFLIRLKDEDGNLYTTVSLGHGERSGYILVVPPEEGIRFTVEEIVPMEYTMTDLRDDYDLKPVIENGFTVLAGDVLNFVITNEPTHTGYFHHTASVTNKKSSGEGNYTQHNDYKEPHGKDRDGVKTASVQEWMIARVDQNEGRNKKRTSERGDEIRG